MASIFWLALALVSLSTFTFIFIPSVLPTTNNNTVRPKKSKIISILTILSSAMLTLVVYFYIGTPSLLAIKNKVAIEDEYAEMISRVEQHLQQTPQDAEGWQVLAPIYLGRNQPKKAFQAFANAIKHGNSNGANWLGLGKADLAINQGVFSPMSKVAFSKAHQKSPDSIEAMVFYASYLADAKQLDIAEHEIDDFINNHKHPLQDLKPLMKIKALIKADREK